MLECEDALKMMHRMSLLTDYNSSERTIKLHDAIRDYLVRAKAQNMTEWHQKFLDGFEIKKWSDVSEDDLYLWTYLPYHLINAQRTAEFVDLIFDFEWLQKKLYVTTFETVLTDFNYVIDVFASVEVEVSNSIRLLNDILRLIGVVVSTGKQQLASYLYGNLISVSSRSELLTKLLTSISHNALYSWLRPFYPISVTVAEGLVQSLSGDLSPKKLSHSE